MPVKFNNGKKVTKKSAPIGSIFINRSKIKGIKYFKISLSADALETAQTDAKGYIILIGFENGYKESDQHPDYVVYLGENNREAGSTLIKCTSNVKPVRTTRTAHNVETEAAEEETDDSSPF